MTRRHLTLKTSGSKKTMSSLVLWPAYIDPHGSGYTQPKAGPSQIHQQSASTKELCNTRCCSRKGGHSNDIQCEEKDKWARPWINDSRAGARSVIVTGNPSTLVLSMDIWASQSSPDQKKPLRLLLLSCAGSPNSYSILRWHGHQATSPWIWMFYSQEEMTLIS